MAAVRAFTALLCVCGGILLPLGRTCAREETLGPLVQVTTPADEYLGLVHLGLLVSPENYNGDVSQSIQNVMPSIVQIRTGNLLASGIILEVGEDTLLIASNRHQLGQHVYSTVSLYNGSQVSARRVYLSERYDVGFLLADISQLSYEKRALLRSVAIQESCNEQLSRGSEIFMVGSTDGVACNISEGIVADPWYYFDEFGSHMLYNYCKAKPGMSGGGTFDVHGHCVGMITGGYEGETASLPMGCILEERQYIPQEQTAERE